MLAFSAASCSADSDGPDESARPTVPADTGSTAPTSSTPSTAPGTSAPTASPPTTGAAASAGDWDGARYDVGTVDRLERRDGRVAVVFDRQQLDGKSGKELTKEPILGGYRSGDVSNDTRQLRTFYAASGVEVLRLSNRDEACNPEREAELTWERVSLDDAISRRLWTEWILVSLVFDDKGAVTRIRFSNDC